jgi:hypothetical protein
MTKKPTIEQLLGKAFDNYCSEPTAQDRADFVFHMADWKADLEALHRLYDDPGTLSRKEAHDAVFGFLAHATWHLNAAYRLLMGYEVPDPFGMSEAAQTKKLGAKSLRTKAKKINARTAKVGTASPKARKKTRM